MRVVIIIIKDNRTLLLWSTSLHHAHSGGANKILYNLLYYDNTMLQRVSAYCDHVFFLEIFQYIGIGTFNRMIMWTIRSNDKMNILHYCTTESRYNNIVLYY